MLRHLFVIGVSLFFGLGTALAQSRVYPWLNDYDSLKSLVHLVKVPNGFARTKVEEGSYADWLRHLPIREGQKEIYLYDGKKVTGHDANYVVVDVDVGDKDLQQCGDAVIRFRAEYLFSKQLFGSISFIFTSGDTAHYSDWLAGYRPNVNGDNVRWIRSVESDSSYNNFREYLDTVFMYAGTYSLSKEMKQVSSIDSLQIGDAFILGGFPGHAVIVADIAMNPATGTKLFLLIQGYTPAQEIHVIRNPHRSDGLPWFELRTEDTLEILHWQFTEKHLRRF